MIYELNSLVLLLMFASYQLFCCVVSRYIFTSCAVFSRARGASQNINNEYKYTTILYTKTSNNRFIIQLLQSINLSMKEGECDSFACARRPVLQTGFLLYKYGKQVFYCTNIVQIYFNDIRCSWLIKGYHYTYSPHSSCIGVNT